MTEIADSPAAFKEPHAVHVLSATESQHFSGRLVSKLDLVLEVRKLGRQGWIN